LTGEVSPLTMLWRMRTTTKLVLGGIFAFLGVSCSAIGVGMVVAPSDPEHPASGVALLIMSAGIFIAPAVALLTIGVRSRRAARDLEQVIAMGQASARLPLQQIAEQIGVGVPRARELVLEAIAAGKLAGRMDFEHGVFVSASAHTGVQQAGVKCPSCGAISQQVLGPGVSARCTFCGHLVA
jgi:hypothetical protein